MLHSFSYWTKCHKFYEEIFFKDQEEKLVEHGNVKYNICKTWIRSYWIGSNMSKILKGLAGICILQKCGGVFSVEGVEETISTHKIEWFRAFSCTYINLL